MPGGMGDHLLNGSKGSKFIVRSVAGVAIKDGAATPLRFIKNLRLIVQELVTHTPLAYTKINKFPCFQYKILLISLTKQREWEYSLISLSFYSCSFQWNNEKGSILQYRCIRGGRARVAFLNN